MTKRRGVYKVSNLRLFGNSSDLLNGPNSFPIRMSFYFCSPVFWVWGGVSKLFEVFDGIVLVDTYIDQNFLPGSFMSEILKFIRNL